VPAPVEELEPNHGGCGGSGTNRPQPGMHVGESQDPRRCLAHRSAERAELHWLIEWII